MTKLRLCRNLINISAQKLSLKAAVSYPKYLGVDKGYCGRSLNPDEASRICRALGREPSELFNEDGTPIMFQEEAV